MNIKKLYENQSFVNNLDPKIRPLLLNQLIIYATEDNKESFDKILEQVNNLLDYYSIKDDYSIDTNNNNVSITTEDQDHCSFLHFSTPNKKKVKI